MYFSTNIKLKQIFAFLNKIKCTVGFIVINYN